MTDRTSIYKGAGPARAVVARAIDLAAGRCPLALYYTALAAAAVAMCAAAEEQ